MRKHRRIFSLGIAAEILLLSSCASINTLCEATKQADGQLIETGAPSRSFPSGEYEVVGTTFKAWKKPKNRDVLFAFDSDKHDLRLRVLNSPIPLTVHYESHGLNTFEAKRNWKGQIKMIQRFSGDVWLVFFSEIKKVGKSKALIEAGFDVLAPEGTILRPGTVATITEYIDASDCPSGTLWWDPAALNSGSSSGPTTATLPAPDRAVGFQQLMLQCAEPTTFTIRTNSATRYDGAYTRNANILNAEVNYPIALGGRRWYTKRVCSRSPILFSAHIRPGYSVKIYSPDANAPTFGLAPAGDRSRAVRTPSYRPGLEFFIGPTRWWKDRDKKGWRKIYLGLHAYHHSNGQDGPEVVENTINTYSGNFSQIVVFHSYLGFVWDKTDATRSFQPNAARHPKGSLPESLKPISTRHHLTLGFEWYPDRSPGDSFLKELETDPFFGANAFGRNRFTASYSCGWFRDFASRSSRTQILSPMEGGFERLRFSFRMKAIFDKNLTHFALEPQVSALPPQWRKRVNAECEFLLRLGIETPLGLFVRGGYYGSDPYNIYFNERFSELKIGVVLTPFGMQ